MEAIARAEKQEQQPDRHPEADRNPWLNVPDVV